MSTVYYNQIIQNSTAGAIGSTMSDIQFCANVKEDLEDTQGKNFALMADLSLLCSETRFNQDDLSMIGDPINNSVSEFTDLSHDNEMRYFSRKAEFRKRRVGLSGDDQIDIQKIFTNKRSKVTNSLDYVNGSIECLKHSQSVEDSIRNTVYGSFINEDSNTVSEMLRDIDDAIPSYENEYVEIPNNKSQDSDLSEVIFDLTSRGELTFNGVNIPTCYSTEDLEDFFVEQGASDLESAIAYVCDDLGISDLMGSTIEDNIRLLDSTRVGAIYDYAGRSDFVIFNTTEGGMFSIPTEPNEAASLLSDLADKTSCQQILIDAAQVIISGSATIADMSARIKPHLDSGGVSTKQVAEAILSIGSNSPNRVAYNFRNTYKALGGTYSEHDGFIEWDLIPPPVFDWSIGSVIVGYLATAAQIVGTFLAFIPVTRILGAVLIGAGSVVRALQHVGADIANTFPDFKYDCIDNCINYPLYQGIVSVSALNPSYIAKLKDKGIIKIENPFIVIYFYNYDESSSTATCKAFPVIAATGLFTNVPQIIPEDLAPEADWRSLFPIPVAGTENHSIFFHGSVDRGVDAQSNVIYFDCSSLEIGDLNSKITPYTLQNFNPKGIYKVNLKELDTHNNDAAMYHGLWNGIGASVAWIIFELLASRRPITLTADVTSNHANNLAYSAQAYGTGNDRIPGTYDSTAADGSGYNISGCSFFPVGNIHSDFTSMAIPLWVIRNAASMFGGTFSDSYHSLVYPDVRSAIPELWGVRSSGNASYYQSIINTFSWIETFLRYYPGGCVSLANNPLSVDAVCFDIDDEWALRLPQRSYQALITAEMVAIITVAAAAAIAVSFKVISKKVLTPRIQKNISNFQNELNLWSSLQNDLNNEPDTSPVDKSAVQKEINQGVYALSKRIRRFNLITKILGLGGFDMAAGFWDGPVSVGANWSIGSDSNVAELDGQSSSLSGLYQSLSKQPTTEELEVTTNDLKKLITG